MNDTPPKILPYYTPGQIALACLLGSPLAAGWLMAATYRGVGDRRKAKLTLILSAVATIVLIGIGFVLPANTARTPLSAIVTIGIFHTAKHFLGSVIESRAASGALKGSWWIAVGVGMLGMIVVLAVVAGIVFLNE